MVEHTTFPLEATRLFRERYPPKLQDLLALRPRSQPGSALDSYAFHLVMITISFRAPVGSEEQRITFEWSEGPGM